MLQASPSPNVDPFADCHADPMCYIRCEELCAHSSDGTCDDGGMGAQWSTCVMGTDCEDCGRRAASLVPIINDADNQRWLDIVRRVPDTRRHHPPSASPPPATTSYAIMNAIAKIAQTEVDMSSHADRFKGRKTGVLAVVVVVALVSAVCGLVSYVCCAFPCAIHRWLRTMCCPEAEVRATEADRAIELSEWRANRAPDGRTWVPPPGHLEPATSATVSVVGGAISESDVNSGWELNDAAKAAQAEGGAGASTASTTSSDFRTDS